jgi:hypothetical protein
MRVFDRFFNQIEKLATIFRQTDRKTDGIDRQTDRQTIGERKVEDGKLPKWNKEQLLLWADPYGMRYSRG